MDIIPDSVLEAVIEERDALRIENASLRDECKRLAGEKIKKAAEEGKIMFAKSDIVEYLEPEINFILGRLGHDAIFISDMSCRSDFGLESNGKYLWQEAIDWLRMRKEGYRASINQTKSG